MLAIAKGAKLIGSEIPVMPTMDVVPPDIADVSLNIIVDEV